MGTQPSEAGKCPHGHTHDDEGNKKAASSETKTRVENEEETRACPHAGSGSSPTEGPRCPLGFGGRRPRSKDATPWYCKICSSLLYHTMQAGCGHVFCEECLDKCRDCPLCGADVNTKTARRDIDDAVEAYAATPAVQAVFAEDGLSLYGSFEDDPEVEKRIIAALFYMHVGNRALAVGNVLSASHWFKHCMASIAEDSGSSRRPKHIVDKPLWCMANGLLGDCVRARMNFDEARELYQASIDVCQESSEGLGQNMYDVVAMTKTKIGEIYYAQGKFDDALKIYEETLALRCDCAKNAPRTHADTWVPLNLCVAKSHVKVADVLHRLVESKGYKDVEEKNAFIARGREHAATARRILEEVMPKLRTIWSPASVEMAAQTIACLPDVEACFPPL